MGQISKITLAKAAVVLSVIPILLWAASSSPDLGHTGAPNEAGTCLSCHPAESVGTGSVKVDFPAGYAYVPNVTQRLTVTIADTNQKRWGFQLTARQASNTTVQAGAFTAGSDGYTQVYCFDVVNLTQSAAPCTSITHLQYVEHTAAGTRNGQKGTITFVFDWTPLARDLGDVNIYVSAVAADGDTSPYGDFVYTQNYTLRSPLSAKPAITKVVNAAGFQTTISPGSWASIMGANLAPSTRSWGNSDIVDGALPTQLDGVSVTINDKPAYVAYISPGQINVLAPADSATGPVSVVVSNNGIATDAASVPLQTVAPAFFLWLSRYAVATRPDFSLVASESLFAPQATAKPARPGEVIILWGTGFGPTNPAAPVGRAVPSGQLYNVVNLPTILIDNIQAKVVGAALSPGSAGLYQIAIEVPPVPWDGDHSISARVAGVSSPANALLNIQQ